MIVCNWKMFGDRSLVQDYIDFFEQHPHLSTDIIVCPPFPWMGYFPRHIPLGGQNCHQENDGPFTGEVSAKMLKACGCQYVLLGHSERRQYYGENAQLVTEKAKIALSNGITPIVCVGSKLDHEEGVQEDVFEQLSLIQSMHVIIAYEPLWAIGTNKIPSIQHIQHITHWMKDLGFKTVLYGGSVNPQNAKDIYNICDGLLIGRASLDLDPLGQIVQAVLQK